MAKVGVILSGCGVFDGTEIHEAVCVLLALDQRGAKVQCMAPRKHSRDVIDHLAKKPQEEIRDVLVESARIARGDVIELAKVKGGEYDAFILPGGFGAAKNLCSFAADGENCAVDPDVARVLQEAHRAGKPLGFACIAPVIAARIFGESNAAAVTIGHDEETASKIEMMGARHIECDADDIVVDETNKIVSTPCYMEAKSIGQVYSGASKLVDKVLELAKHPATV